MRKEARSTEFGLEERAKGEAGRKGHSCARATILADKALVPRQKPRQLPQDSALDRIERNEDAFSLPSFDTSCFDCPYSAPITGFDCETHFPENKALRLMGRDAQMAVVAETTSLPSCEILTTIR